MTLPSGTTPGQSGLESNNNEGIVHILQITGEGLAIRLFNVISRTPMDVGRESYSSAEIHSVCSTAPADRA